MNGYPRPWCCPEPRCQPVYNHQVTTDPTPGDSFICFGMLGRTVEFSYDGAAHANDLSHCDYTPLKGIIRWQENRDDWLAVVRSFRVALRKLQAVLDGVAP